MDIESTAEGASGYFYEMCMKAMSDEESGKKPTDMDYKFHFFPWFLEPAYELEDDFPIRKETVEYFRKVASDPYVMRKYP